MKLKQVQIKNFRSIADATITFDPTFLVLVGVNESGKTSVLRAIQLLDPETPVNSNDRREVSADEDVDQESWVRFVFELDSTELRDRAKELAARLVCLPDEPLMMDGRVPLRLHEVVKRQGALYRVDIQDRRKFGSYWARGKSLTAAENWWKPKALAPEDIELPTDPQSKTHRFLHEAKLVHGSFVTDRAREHVEPATADDIWTATAAGMAKLVVTSLPPVIFWEHSEKYLLPDSLSLAEFETDPDVCIPLRHMFALAGYRDASAALAGTREQEAKLRRLLERVSKIATQHLHARWEELAGVKLELAPNGPNVNCFVRDAHNVYEMNRRSDGFKRFVTFLLMISARVAKDDLVGAVFLQDEPDSSLHPSGIRYLRDEFIKIAEKNIVVCSTHSMFMVDGDDLSRHLLVAKKDEQTTVRVAAADNFRDEEVIYQALGFSGFDLIPADSIIFEGWGDRVLFAKARQALSKDHKALKKDVEKLGLTNVRGVTDVGRIAPLLDLAKRRWIVVSDSDDAGKRLQKEYSELELSGPWLRYDELLGTSEELTCEDFLTEPYFERAVARALADHQPPLELPGWLPTRGARLSRLKEALSKAGLKADKSKALVTEIKSTLTRSLTADNISSEYQKVVEAIAETLKKRAG